MGEGLHVLAHAAARPLGVRAQHGGLDDALRVRVRVRVRVRATPPSATAEGSEAPSEEPRYE